jgi:hypothetical protein
MTIIKTKNKFHHLGCRSDCTHDSSADEMLDTAFRCPAFKRVAVFVIRDHLNILKREV